MVKLDILIFLDVAILRECTLANSGSGGCVFCLKVGGRYLLRDRPTNSQEILYLIIRLILIPNGSHL